MLMKLSQRNAKRQFKDYALYLITLVCAVSFMFAFNALIFSDSVKMLPELEILPYIVIAVSLLIILVLGWIVSYMTNYMLKKRSKELSIYMVSGIPNKSINKLLFYENLFIGGIAFAIGILFGLLLSQLLEAALLNVFGLSYNLAFQFSLPTVGLTFVYFTGIFLFALVRNGKWIRKTKIYDLLYYEKQNEEKLTNSKISSWGLLILSVISGLTGTYIIIYQPFGSGYNAFVGVILLVLFLFGLFISIPSYLSTCFGNQNAWKYTKNRLVAFRAFTSKIRSMSTVMGVLSILFMLSMTLFGTGIAANMIAARSIDLNPFDILILHNGAMADFSGYEDGIIEITPIQANYEYEIFTDSSKIFHNIRDRVVTQSGRDSTLSYTEFQSDTYMRQSDYLRLRQMLGYESVETDENSYSLHCVPALEKAFTSYMVQSEAVEISGRLLDSGNVYSEPFSQNDAYGNGQDYIVVVPDDVVSNMQVLYSLYAVITESPLNSAELQRLTLRYENLVLLDRNSVAFNSASMAGHGTALVKSDVDYISGKWAQKETLAQLYSFLICLFYLALILEITGAAILATQVLNDGEKKRHQNSILRQLGMSEKQIMKLGNRQLLLLFVLPIIPAIIISSSLIFTGAQTMQLNTYSLPMFANNLWAFQTVGISIVLFTLLYGLYYAAARVSYKRQI